MSEKSTENQVEIPSLEQLEAEYKNEQHKIRFGQVLRSTLFSLVVVAAVVVLITILFLPVLQIAGSSMTDTLHEGDVVLALSGAEYETGDIVAFYYNNNILVKRVIANSGEWVDIDADGNVFVNGEELDEPSAASLSCTPTMRAATMRTATSFAASWSFWSTSTARNASKKWS